MGRIVKLLRFVLIISFIGLASYAYLGEYFGADFSPPQTETRVPVTLETE